MLEILTPLIKLERVSRLFDKDNFVAVPGLWAEVTADGSLKNVVTDTPAAINKLVITSASDNIYESHDIEAGRITTLESIGARVMVDSEGYDGTINQGDTLVVSTADGTEGKLVSTAETSETGEYEVVARAEVVNASEGYIIYRTISPEVITLS